MDFEDEQSDIDSYANSDYEESLLDSSDESESDSSNESDFFDEEDEPESVQNTNNNKFLTKFEKTRVLGIRAEQILAGSVIFVKTNSVDPYEIALEELNAKKSPLIIRRYFNNNYIDINVNSLELL